MEKKIPKGCASAGCDNRSASGRYCATCRRRGVKAPAPAPGPAAVCSVGYCLRPVKARGWCAAHYRNALRHGTPEPEGSNLELRSRAREVVELGAARRVDVQLARYFDYRLGFFVRRGDEWAFGLSGYDLACDMFCFFLEFPASLNRYLSGGYSFSFFAMDCWSILQRRGVLPPLPRSEVAMVDDGGSMTWRSSRMARERGRGASGVDGDFLAGGGYTITAPRA